MREPSNEPDAPLVVRLDIRPEFGPPRFEAVLVVCLSIGAIAFLVIVATGDGFEADQRTAFLLAFGGFGAVMALLSAVLLHKCWRWRRWRTRRKASRDDALLRWRACTEEEKAMVYEWQVRRAWPPAALRRSMDRDGAPPPRAVVIGPSQWSRGLPMHGVVRDLLEPEVVVPRPTWGFMARRMFSGSGMFDLAGKFIVFGPCLLLLLSVLLLSVPTLVLGRPRAVLLYGVSAAVIGGVLIGGLSMYGRALLGAAVLAGPSFIERAGLFRKTLWTPRNTTLVVRRTRNRVGVVVDFATSHAPTAPRGNSLRFYGLDDPGFQTLWKMWLHPVDGAALMDHGATSPSSEAAAPKGAQMGE